MKSIKKISLLAAANLGLLALLLCLTEVALRIARIPYTEEVSPSELAISRFDPDLGWAYLPNLSKTITIGSNVRAVHFDENGIRVPAPGHHLSPTRPSVLFVGCSFTMGHGLSYEESFVGQFQALAGTSFQAVNLGVQAYGTDQALLALQKFAPRFNTKVVVYTFIEDHIYRNGNYDRRYLYPEVKYIGTKPLFGLDRDHAIYLAKAPLLYKDYRHSYLYDLLKMKLEPRPPYPEELTKALIREMNDYCKKRKIRFVLVNWRWSKTDYDDFNDLAAKKIDTLESAPAGWESMRIPEDGHPNTEASTHVARLLQRYLKARVQ